MPFSRRFTCLSMDGESGARALLWSGLLLLSDCIPVVVVDDQGSSDGLVYRPVGFPPCSGQGDVRTRRSGPAGRTVRAASRGRCFPPARRPGCSSDGLVNRPVDLLCGGWGSMGLPQPEEGR